MKALQDIEWKNGEEVNVLSLKIKLESAREIKGYIFLFKKIDEKLHLKQMESFEVYLKDYQFNQSI